MYPSVTEQQSAQKPEQPEKNPTEKIAKATTYSLDLMLQDKYHLRQREARIDLLKFLPPTTLRQFTRQGNKGLYGWTHRHKSNLINIRENLAGEQRLQTEIHESIHTPDEYETRRITEWILETMFPKPEPYATRVPLYRR